MAGLREAAIGTIVEERCQLITGCSRETDDSSRLEPGKAGLSASESKRSSQQALEVVDLEVNKVSG